ncbi:DUF6069 family protein [Kribbella sp. NPDC051770]|uniref:DUF6069 family protein n=1 Tax=Kribbella sp. NPDC051770 TaxID=3155413 RepID=UPI003439ACC6
MTGQAVVRPARSSAAAITAGIIGAALLSTALNTAVAGIARAAGASPDFVPLDLQTYTPWTVIGVLAGFAGWAVVRARATRPRRLLRQLVPAVVSTSWTPDFIVGFNNSMAGTSWGAMIALMIMHVVIGVVVVISCIRLLPLPADRPPRQ